MQKRNGDYATKIIVAPGDKPGSHPYGTKTVTNASDMMFPLNWKTASTDSLAMQYDYGIIRLPSAFSGNPATLTLNANYSTTNYTNLSAGMLGYDYATAKLWEHRGRISYANSSLVYTKLDTLPGMSGCPIVDNNNTVVGINCYGISGNYTWEEIITPVEDNHPDYNKGPRITSAVKAFLEQNGN